MCLPLFSLIVQLILHTSKNSSNILKILSNHLFLISLDTIGFIGKTLNGKAYMVSNAKFGDFIGKLIQMIRSAQSDIR
jgi:hypothetical protein